MFSLILFFVKVELRLLERRVVIVQCKVLLGPLVADLRKVNNPSGHHSLQEDQVNCKFDDWFALSPCSD